MRSCDYDGSPMTMTPQELELKATELELRREELSFQRTKLFIEFAKFGFGGTLMAAIIAMGLVFALAGLSAFTAFKIGDLALVGMTLVILVGAVAFGYLSLWELPKIATRIQKEQMEISVGAEKKDPTRVA